MKFDYKFAAVIVSICLAITVAAFIFAFINNNTLKKQNADLKGQVATLQSQIKSLQKQAAQNTAANAQNSSEASTSSTGNTSNTENSLKVMELYAMPFSDATPVRFEADKYDKELRFNIYDSDKKDSSGNTYGSCFVTYELNGKAKKLTGNLKAEFGGMGGNYLIFKIYDENNKALYTSPKLTPAVDPQNINIDLTGKMSIKIEVLVYGDMNVNVSRCAGICTDLEIYTSE